RSFNAPMATYVAPDQIQGTYAWGNTYNGASAAPWVDDRGNVRANIQLGRDYFTTAKPGYTPYTYPHPLVSGGGSTTPAPTPTPTPTPVPSNRPSAPSNFRAIR